LDFEKVEIAKRHIIPKQLTQHGLKNCNIILTDEIIQKIVSEYTREAGVRNLEREIATLFRKTARNLVLKDIKSRKTTKAKLSYKIDEKRVEEYLGVQKFKRNNSKNKTNIGSITGLAWTSVGGELLRVDATIMTGSEKFTITGQIGDVMKESAQAALSYLRSHAKEFGLSLNFQKGKEIHIHLPEGAIPKDGPSAGITLTMALYSAFKKKSPKKDVAMTGEITLLGEVLPIGGLNEKLLAAQRGGIKTVLIPKENEKDLVEIKHEVKDGMKIVPVSTIKEAFPYVFGRLTPTTRKIKK